MKAMLCVLGLLGLLALPPEAVAADVSGTWKGAFDYQGSTVALTMHLKIDGTRVMGTVEGLPTTPAEIHDGALAGDTVSFWVNTDYQGQTYKLVYKGKVATDRISFDFGTEDGSWSSPLTVKRSDAGPEAVPDLTGDWKGTFDLQGTPTELKFHLKSSGNAVTGTVERPGSLPSEVHDGKIDGDTVSFWITTKYQGETYSIVYKGKITPGEIHFDFGTAEQNWSAQVTATKLP